MSNNFGKVTFSDPDLISGLTTATGDLIVGSGPSGLINLSVGTNGQVLTADSGEPVGLKWETPSGGGGPIALGDLTDVVNNGATGTILTFGGTTTDDFLFGQSSGLSIVTPNQNTYIGTAVGSNITSSTKSLLLGNNIFPTITTLNNTVAIGNDITGAGSNNNSVIIGNDIDGDGTNNNNLIVGRGSATTNGNITGSTILGNEAVRSGASNISNCVAVGNEALSFVGSNITSVVAIGLQSCLDITESNNIGIGNFALSGGGPGPGNLAIGVSAGDNLRNNAFSNILLGNDSCLDGMEGNRNIFAGNTLGGPNFNSVNSIGLGNTYNNCVSSTDSIVLGHRSCIEVSAITNCHFIGNDIARDFSSSTFQSTVCIGSDSLRNANDIRFSAILGNSCMNQAFDCEFCIAIGHVVLFNATICTNNVGIGDSSLLNTTSGSFNVAVGGFNTGSGITTGNRNIALGSNNMYGTVSGNNNIVIGNDTVEEITGNDNVYIGNRNSNTIPTIPNSGNRNIVIGSEGFNTGFNSGDDANVLIGDVGKNISVNRGIAIGRGGALIDANDGIIISTNGGTLRNNGDVQLGNDLTTIPSSALRFRTQLVANTAWIGGGTTGASIDNQGNIIRTPSDARLKENISDLSFSTAELMKIRPRTFNYAEKYAERFGKSGVGFIAQELSEIIPEAVNRADIEIQAEDAEEREYALGVDSAKLIPYLVSCIQELNARISALEGK